MHICHEEVLALFALLGWLPWLKVWWTNWRAKPKAVVVESAESAIFGRPDAGYRDSAGQAEHICDHSQCVAPRESPTVTVVGPKILEAAVTDFANRCETCKTVFTYTLGQTRGDLVVMIKCPSCKRDCYHIMGWPHKPFAGGTV